MTTRLSSITSRRSGRLLAAAAACLTFGLAVYTAISQVDRVLHLYDGLWMLAGAALAVGLTAPLIWSWPRERALLALAVASILGTWGPLVLLALRAHISIAARLKGAVFFSSADIVGIALPVSIMLAWLALREHRPRSSNPQ
jgi:hypothetical protein